VEMDHGALWRQIRVATKMRLSIDIGSLLWLPDALQFDVRCRGAAASPCG
jgi:hypothetical protein